MQNVPNRPQVTHDFFEVAERMPSSLFYWAAIGSILTSAFLFLIGRRSWSLFVGQWVPTFLIIPLFNQLLRPSQEQPYRQMSEASQEAMRSAREMTR
jgi:hypothetical protein